MESDQNRRQRGWVNSSSTQSRDFSVSRLKFSGHSREVRLVASLGTRATVRIFREGNSVNDQSTFAEEVLIEALALPAATRHAFIEKRCNGNDDTASRLIALLDGYEE